MKTSYMKYLLALLLFGSNGIVACLIHKTSYEIVLLRTFLGSVFLVAVFLLGKNKFSFYKNPKHFLFLAISGVAMGLSWMLLYEAYARIGVGLASLLYYCGPVIVMVLSPIVFKERLTATKIIGFLAVLMGVLLINSNQKESGGDFFGVLCALLSAVMYAFMVLFNKKSEKITGLENAALQLCISFFTVAVFCLFRGADLGILSKEVAAVLVLGVLNTGVGCYLYFSSIHHLPVQGVAILGYLEPLSAVLFSALFLHESMSAVQWLGALFILGGAAFAELSQVIVAACRKRRNIGA